MSKENKQMSSQSKEELLRTKLLSNWILLKDHLWYHTKETVDLLFQSCIIDTRDVRNIKATQDDFDKIDYMLMKVLDGNNCETLFDILEKNGICKQGKGSDLEWNFQGGTTTNQQSSTRSGDLEKNTKELEKKWEKENNERKRMWEEHSKKRDENWEKRVKEVEEKWKKYMEEEEEKWDNVRDELYESKCKTHAKLESQSKEYVHLQGSYKAAKSKIIDMTKRLKEKQSTICKLEREIIKLKELFSGSDLATSDKKMINGNRESIAFQKHVDKQHGRMGNTKQQTQTDEQITMKENQIDTLKEEISNLRNGMVESKVLHLQGTKYAIGPQPGRYAPNKNGSSPGK